jgi:hypothetical protein
MIETLDKPDAGLENPVGARRRQLASVCELTGRAGNDRLTA